MKSQHSSVLGLPKKPGIYKFVDRDGVVLYVGKATSLRDRVKSYFSKDLIESRGPHIVDMVLIAEKVDFIQTDSVLEALILEAETIKKIQPKYNTKEKDDKSFLCVVITKEQVPKVLIVRKKDIDEKANIVKIMRGKKTLPLDVFYGPFTSGPSLRIAMRIIRRIFPYIDADSIKKDNQEFYKQLGLSPEKNTIYKNNIKNLKNFLSGKKQSVLTDLKKQMNLLAKDMKFEQANEIKKQIFALEHINDIALIKDDLLEQKSIFINRVEAYDIAHMSGQNMVGVMVVVSNGIPEKSEYKKFNIEGIKKANDPAALKQVLERRFSHSEWTYPDLLVVDGNKIQINVAKKVLKDFNLNIPVVSIVKDEKHKPREIIFEEDMDQKIKKSLEKVALIANNEAHRFAIGFHKQKRSKIFLK